MKLSKQHLLVLEVIAAILLIASTAYQMYHLYETRRIRKAVEDIDEKVK